MRSPTRGFAITAAIVLQGAGRRSSIGIVQLGIEPGHSGEGEAVGGTTTDS